MISQDGMSEKKGKINPEEYKENDLPTNKLSKLKKNNRLKESSLKMDTSFHEETKLIYEQNPIKNPFIINQQKENNLGILKYLIYFDLLEFKKKIDIFSSTKIENEKMMKNDFVFEKGPKINMTGINIHDNKIKIKPIDKNDEKINYSELEGEKIKIKNKLEKEKSQRKNLIMSELNIKNYISADSQWILKELC